MLIEKMSSTRKLDTLFLTAVNIHRDKQLNLLVYSLKYSINYKYIAMVKFRFIFDFTLLYSCTLF